MTKISKKIILIGGDPNSINSEIIYKSWRKLERSIRNKIYIIANYELLKKQFSKKFAYLTNSWTNAAIAILLALKIKKGDEIIIPACTFVACANIIEIVGAKVVFADIDPKTKLMDINDCLKKITKKTKAIMPVHLYGNLFPTFVLKRKIRKNIFIIEDSAHAFSGEYNNRPLGFYADFLIFSFYATKSITCGEGGAILSNNKKTTI